MSSLPARTEHDGIRLRGGNREAFQSTDPEVLIEGPRGTGKTVGLWWKIIDSVYRYPGCRVLVIRQTQSAIAESVHRVFARDIRPHLDSRSYKPYGSDRRPEAYEFSNGSGIVFGGMDKDTKKLSTQYDIIYWNEVIEGREDAWESLSGSNRNFAHPELHQQLLADCNPGPPNHWVMRRCNRGLMRHIRSRHCDNPAYYDSKRKEWTRNGKIYLGNMARSLTGIRYLRLFKGEWAAAEGMVYGDVWDPSVHIIAPFEIPDLWPRIRCVDFGYTHPFCCQWWAFDGDGRMYRYREVFGVRKTVDVWAKIIWDLESDEERQSIVATVHDHDAGDAAILRRELGAGRHHEDFQKAYKSRVEGIQSVTNRMQVQPDGKARIFWFRNALAFRDPELDSVGRPCCSEEEIESYVWDRNADGSFKKDQPKKEMDDGMDTTRYASKYGDLYVSPGLGPDSEGSFGMTIKSDRRN